MIDLESCTLGCKTNVVYGRDCRLNSCLQLLVMKVRRVASLFEGISRVILAESGTVTRTEACTHITYRARNGSDNLVARPWIVECALVANFIPHLVTPLPSSGIVVAAHDGLDLAFMHCTLPTPFMLFAAIRLFPYPCLGRAIQVYTAAVNRPCATCSHDRIM